MKEVKPTYYNINQLRNHLWASLVQELSKAIHTGKDPMETIGSIIEKLDFVEEYYAFPGKGKLQKIKEQIRDGKYVEAHQKISGTAQKIVSRAYRNSISVSQELENNEKQTLESTTYKEYANAGKKYFELLLVDRISDQEARLLKDKFKELQKPDDAFFYGINVQPSLQDALIALFFNSNIQAVVIYFAPIYASEKINDDFSPYMQNLNIVKCKKENESDLGPILAKAIQRFRPDIDLYYVTDTELANLKDSTLDNFERIFYGKEDLQEMHLSILKGIQKRFKAPFFSALKEYSKKPTGVFHAMPISRGNSVFKSHWISDFGEFYGRNVFLAETSATTGGLDSLLQPTGPLKQAQEMAAKAYGANQTFFVTNGTSTANKIVLQSIIQPGDIVMIDRDCHKSHHYALVLAGGVPVYLDSYPIEEYSMYGAVPLSVIKEKLYELKENGRLDAVKMLILTNCTFDGLVYNPEMVMQEILTIKPDMVFLWDEAWFAFASFTYLYRQRTAMFNAKRLFNRYQSKEYKTKYKKHIQSLQKGEHPKLPDPEKVKIRVYATQSTHKTLSSFRQGSMIHIWDEDYRRKVSDVLHEAYMTHTSTSPNYQLLASLDVGRRQVQFEGFEMVENSLERSMELRVKINQNETLKKYFKILTSEDVIPTTYRKSGLQRYYSKSKGWLRMENAWKNDEFVLDPTKITLSIGATGVDGDTFKNAYLMDQFNIQINKTSRNTILLMTNIGTTSSSVAYLTNALLQIANELDDKTKAMNHHELLVHNKRITSLTQDLPPLPDFSSFHATFQAVAGVPGGNIREPYFKAYEERNCTYSTLEDCLQKLKSGEELVSTSFVIPYPPGFPVLVPGQVVSLEIIEFLLALDVTEIHGYRPELGLKLFTEQALQQKV